MNKIEEAKQVLREAGYYVDNLWHIDDVEAQLNEDLDVEYTEEEAYEVLDSVLSSEYVIQFINEEISSEIN